MTDRARKVSDKRILLSIVAHARSGAVDYAWRLLREANLDRINDDPAVLSVVGRLLKDRALNSAGEARRRLYTEAAEAYARAGKLNGSTYPLINAATLSLLAGAPDLAKRLAEQVLELDQRTNEEETPYFRAATRAEALLLLGDIAQAKTVFREAIALAPRAFEDHASTLRQFGLILAELREDQGWLDTCRPPRCVHFAGHMGISDDDKSISPKIRTVLQDERVGFGFGALAAGADILVAEALLEQGAELHVVLPAPPALFRETSVAPFGADWVARFDRVLKAADTLRSVEADSAPTSSLALQLASSVAMGSAVMQADVLMTEAVQLVILDRDVPAQGRPGSSNWISSNWESAGRRQRVIAVPRMSGEPSAGGRASEELAPHVLVAMLRIEWPEPDTDVVAKNVLPHLARIVASGPSSLYEPRWTGEALVVVFASPAEAASVALTIIAETARMVDLRIAGHYGIVSLLENPFGGPPLLSGVAATLPRCISHSTPPGAIHVSEDFVAVLYAGPAEHRPRIEYVGELPAIGECNPIRLFSVAR